jgi:iron complex outermembrane receptor protein
MITFDETARNDIYSGLFLVDKLHLLGGKMSLSLGTKVDYNSYTGVEWQPGVRSSYAINERNTVWAAIMRAVRTPSRTERTMDVMQVFPENFLAPGSPMLAGVLDHTSDFDSENMIAYEMGYRNKLTRDISLDLALFYNDYHELRSIEPTLSPGSSLIFATLGNRLTADSYGAELSGRWQVCDWWRLTAYWAYAEMNVHANLPTGDIYGEELIENDLPQNQMSLFSNMQLPWNLEFDGWLRYVDSAGPAIPSYTTLDLRLGWKVSENVELSLVGQNLLDRSVLQTGQSTVLVTQLTEVERSVYGKVTVTF